MKINVYFYSSDVYGEGHIFQQWDKIIGVTSLNDANWRHEYFDPIFDQVGIEIATPEVDEEYLEAVLRKWYGY
jgi:hypothetical protein